MRTLIMLAGLCLLVAGCGDNPNGAGNGKNGPGNGKEAGGVYEAVLGAELKGSREGEGFYFFLDGKDPEPELLQRLQKSWPKLQPGSKAPQGKANRVSIDGLKWIDPKTVELHGGFSNGMDGRSSRYRIVSKGGAWVVEQVVVEAES